MSNRDIKDALINGKIGKRQIDKDGKGITFARNEYSLTVYGQTKDTGALVATGGSGQAGIGGGKETEGKIVTINGGTVIATGGYKGAGIGGGSYCSGGTVNINGGSVTAKANGEQQGAAIGAGYSGSGCRINVSKGMIAVAGNSAETAAETAADQLSDKKWAYIEKS